MSPDCELLPLPFGQLSYIPKVKINGDLENFAAVPELLCMFFHKTTRNGVLDLPSSEPFTQALGMQNSWFYYE